MLGLGLRLRLKAKIRGVSEGEVDQRAPGKKL